MTLDELDRHPEDDEGGASLETHTVLYPLAQRVRPDEGFLRVDADDDQLGVPEARL